MAELDFLASLQARDPFESGFFYVAEDGPSLCSPRDGNSSAKLSYKDVLGSPFSSSVQMVVDDVSDDEFEDDQSSIPCVHLSKEEKRRVRSPWVNALLLNLRGKSLPFKRNFGKSGKCFGSLQKVDYHTNHNSRGRFARFCVLVPCNKPLINKIKIGRLIQELQYEDVSCCFTCGIMGHKNTDCAKNKEDNTKVVEVEKSELGPWMLVNNRKNSKSRSRGRSRTKANHRGWSDRSQGQNDRHPVKIWRPKSKSNFEKSKEAGPSGTKQLCDGCCDPESVGQPTLVILDKGPTGTQNEEVAEFIGPCPNVSESEIPSYSHSQKSHVEANSEIKEGISGEFKSEKPHERQHITEEESGAYRCGANSGGENPKIGAEGQNFVSFQCADSSVVDDGNADFVERGGCGKTSKADDVNGDIDSTLSNKDLPSITPCEDLRSGSNNKRIGHHAMRLRKILRTARRRGMEWIDPIGFSGGIWLLWNADEFDVHIHSKTQQEITALAKVRSLNQSYAISAVYASPDRESRLLLWDYLACLGANLNLHWIWIGDFNETLCSLDKYGGRVVNPLNSSSLNDALSSCDMIDIGFVGPRFTWSNKNPISTLILERIDRAWINSAWLDSFPESTLFHLPRICSDHCPILFSTNASNPVFEEKPFRFQPMWFSDSSFFDVVKSVWDSNVGNFDSKILDFIQAVKEWNKNVFGNVFHKKNRLLARIKGAQLALANNPSQFLIDLEKQLQTDFIDILRQEETLWAMKSRIDWLKDGDKNTKFFHLTTKVRRKCNRIVALKDNVGNWLYNDDCKKHVIDFFSNLYTTEFPSHDLVANYEPPSIVKIDSQVHGRLVAIPSIREIKDALWSLKPFKAPGTDGLHAGFFQKCWDDIKDSLVQAIKAVFENNCMPDSWKHFLICLVPKTVSPDCIKLFRPISLANTCYKIVTKIIALRMKSLMNDIINPVQAAFISGRRASDNIILVQEALHSARVSSSKEGWMFIKIDLEKAFDRLEWGFIRDMLKFFNFPNNLIKLIMSCISDPSLAILINGSSSDEFHASRGIRQGDPISPYLFLLSMEYLSLLIENEVDNNSWNPIQIGRNGPKFSHALFADDIILAARANMGNCMTISRILDDFCHRSGQKVNKDKTKMWFSPKVSDSLAFDITNMLGFSRTNNLGTYLGHPLLVNKAKKADFGPLIEKIRNRLAGWKAKNLSLAGKSTLIQSVTSSIVDYPMQASALPPPVLDEIDRLQRNFLWGDSEEKRKIHSINWVNVTKAKRKGGLNLRRSRLRNVALMAKLIWRVKRNPENMWVKALCSKYNFDTFHKKSNNSNTWLSIRKGKDVFRRGCKKVINSGINISFWLDTWVGVVPLREIIHGPFNRNEENIKVSSCVNLDGTWNFDCVSFVLPDFIIDKIHAIPYCLQNPREDTFTWNLSSNGEFSLDTAYILAANDDFIFDPFWKKLWKSPCNNRIRHFLWLSAHNRLTTNSLLHNRQISDNFSCDLCIDSEEDCLHVLRDCTFATEVWQSFSLPDNFFDSLSIKDWIDLNLSSSMSFRNTPWPTLFAYSCWAIWKARNSRTFLGKVALPFTVKTQAVNLSIEFFHLAFNNTTAIKRNEILVSWIPPLQGWFKLNSDGSVEGNPGIAGSGGAIRDDQGQWVAGYSRKIGYTSSLQAEFWGLRDGLILAHSKGIQKLEVNVDALNVITLINNADISVHPLGNIIYDCRMLMQRFPCLNLSHCFREGNMVADALANNGRVQQMSFSVFDVIPYFVFDLLMADTAGISLPRLVNT
ncbi:reverse transcriptase [Corchorus capsularis]|uniref:Reverse transcriptase n=1 Tax=Corchorus capsularis TaxID=210143 RepID=A0A1R3J102_COCAP|nr:reverse transcriptase [Corchorus capsularis]